MRALKMVPILVLWAVASMNTLGARPQLSTSPQSHVNPQLVEQLVYANRILYDQGILDAFGHVSVRDDKNPNHFLLSRSIAPVLVTSKDILEYDLAGAPLNAGDRKSYLERFIHAAIYRARPDVIAVVHSHSPSVIPFGITGTALRPVYHMSAFLGTGAPIFDIREAAGTTDMLVSDNKLGDALAKTLGNGCVALLRGHGAVVTGTSIEQVVFRAYYTEMNARLQTQAMGLGPVTYLSPAEAAKASAALDAQLTRAWDLWKARIGKIE
jgi:ribulose-5-phosphate 4-epimerase/fuculose-1-phosphate aldolase